MTKKCESCRHFFIDPALEFKYGVCGSEDVLGVMVGSAEVIDINAGRLICDKEGDGVFVYHDPIEPTAGAAAELPAALPPSAALPLVQITREPVLTRMSSNSNPPPSATPDWRRELNNQLHGRAAGGA
jgi:hypothetical protein